VSNRTFIAGLVVCVALMLAFGGAIALLNAGNNRPEGVAEDWLTAVGDTVREGVEEDARARAKKIGPLSLAEGLVQANPDRKTAFPDLEVGKADEVAPDFVQLPFKLHTRVGEDEIEKSGLIIMRKRGDDWRVINVVLLSLDEIPPLPSAGGPPPSSAPISLWIGALVGAALIGVVSSAVVRSAGRATTSAAAA
jgi:hypothetical protein